MTGVTHTRIAAAAVLCLPFLLHAQDAAKQPPKTWIDPDTGHRVVRLTDEPDSASLYFNQNGYTADHKKLVYTTPQGIWVLDLETHATRQLATGRVRAIIAGFKTQNVYYIKDNASVWAADADTGATREIATLPKLGTTASISTINADETLLAGAYTDLKGPDYNPNRPQTPQNLIQPAKKAR